MLMSGIGSSFDFCFVDTPPSLGWLTQSAFFASQNSIICAIPEAYSVLAMRRLKEFHDSIANYHPIVPLGIVLSFWDERGAVNQNFIEEIDKHFPDKLFCSKVRRDVSVSRSVLQGHPVIEADPLGRASQDYQALTCEFLSRIDHLGVIV
jgi:chromosome partitioning protein